MAADGSGFHRSMQDGRETEIVYRRPRIFISHVWGRHDKFAVEIVSLLNSRFTQVDDLSIYENLPESDTDYDALENLLLKSKIAARIFCSDVVFASLDSSVSHSKWVRSELELASIAYTKPIILVDEARLLQKTSLRKEIIKVNPNCTEVHLDDADGFIRAVEKFVPKHVPDIGDLSTSPEPFPRIPINGLTILREQGDTLDLMPSPEHEEQLRRATKSEMHRRRARRARRARIF